MEILTSEQPIITDTTAAASMHYDLFLQASENFVENCKSVIPLIFPAWKKEKVDYFPINEGLTNNLIKCTSSQESLLIKAFGYKSELFIDRKRELENWKLLNACKLAPCIYCTFNNGLAYSYTDGEPLCPEQLSDPHLAALIAKTLASWHQIPFSSSQKASLFSTIDKWFQAVPKVYLNATHNEAFVSFFNFESIGAQIQKLQSLAKTRYESSLVFCHNDLLSPNIIYNSAKDSITFIDYEYSSINYRAFDIANHFCEFAGFECDYSKYPSKEFQFYWLSNYAQQLAEGSETDLEKLYGEVTFFSIVRKTSHVFWGLWALIQAYYSKKDFDYMTYAQRRFSQFNKLFEMHVAL